MSIDVHVPELGEGVDSVEVVSLLVAEGDTVSEGQGLIEVETDKAAVEIPSPSAGTVASLHVAAGQTLKAGDLVATLEAEERAETGSPGGEAPADDEAVEPADDAAPDSAPQDPAPPPEKPDLTSESSDSADTTTVRVPDLGEGVDSVDVVSVLVEPGDTVRRDQGLIEVETDKASVEIPSPRPGEVIEVLVAPGDTLTQDEPIVTLKVHAGEAAAEAEPPDDRSTAPTPDGEAALSGPGGPSRTARTARQEAPRAESPATEDHLAPRWVPESSGPRIVPAAPSVRRFARELGIDIGDVRGSGAKGRISREDVKAHARMRLSAPQPTSSVPFPDEDLPDFSAWGPVRTEDMSRVRRLTALQMTRAWTQIPMVTHNDLADITDVESFRQRHKTAVAAEGGKLTMTAILVRVVATALRQMPQFNASVDMAGSQIVYKDFVHIGVAVDTPRGLLVPVIRDADQKSLTTISSELDDLASRARDRKLKPDEMQGATFSISNLGGIGGTGFSPIVNWPEVAILGVSRGRMQPEWRDGEFVPRLMLPLGLTYDHRLIDGADAARFVRFLCQALEEPLLLHLG